MTILQIIYTKFHRLLKSMYVKISNTVSKDAQELFFPNRLVYAIILYTSDCGTMKQFRERNISLIDFIAYFEREYEGVYTKEGIPLNSETIRTQYRNMLKKEHIEKTHHYIKEELGIDLFTDPEKQGVKNDN